MGLNLKWIAIEGRDRARLLDRLDLEEAGDASDEMAAKFSCAVLPDGWLVLVSLDRGFKIGEALVKASSDGFALGCEIIETVTSSQVWGFRGGSKIWSVRHYPDADGDGLQVLGEPPLEYADIESRLQAEQAAEPDVDQMFEAPLMLAARICGYRAGTGQGPDWTIVRPKGARRNKSSARRPKSLSAAFKSTFLPFLRSRGWELARTRPDRYPQARAHDVFRDFGSLEQLMWFDFKGGDDIYFIVNFLVADRALEPSDWIVYGRVRVPSVRLPLWRRFSWRRFLDLTTVSAEAGDPIQAAIDGAHRDILAADRFLGGGERMPSIYVERGVAKDTWPVLPDGRRISSAG